MRATVALAVVMGFVTQAQAASITYTFDADGSLPSSAYPEFTLDGGLAYVTDGRVYLEGRPTDDEQQFTRTGITGTDITLTAQMTGNSNGEWPQGLSFGNRNFIFHPGYPGGAFRVESERGSLGGVFVENVRMGFTPGTEDMHTWTINWQQSSNLVSITVLNGSAGDGVFNYTWTPDAAFDPTFHFGFNASWNVYPNRGQVNAFDNLTITTNGTIASVPEPATATLLLLGLLVIRRLPLKRSKAEGRRPTE